ncbi:34465_t:CDS:2, partial [Gigaspora margarita]
MLSNKSCKVFLVRCNKTVVLCNFTYSQQYELEYFIDDSNLSLHYNLLNAIICGKREAPIIGTPKKYMKIYTECWQHNSNLRPTIQRIFEDLNNIDYKDTINDDDDHEKDKLIIVDTESLIVKALKVAETDNSFNNQNNILSDSLFDSSNPKVQDYFSN